VDGGTDTVAGAGDGGGRHRAPEPMVTSPPVPPPAPVAPPMPVATPPPVQPPPVQRRERQVHASGSPGRWLAWMLTGFLVVGGGLVAGYAALGDPGTPPADSGPDRAASPSSPAVGGGVPPGTVSSRLPAPVVPPCDGSYALIVGSVTTPIGYQDAVVRLLEATPGARWFTTEGTCASLRDRSDEGTLIHAVYLGPFRTAEEALASCGAGPSDAYAKRLDAGTGIPGGADDGVVTCG
jgi:hypothetical protein